MYASEATPLDHPLDGDPEYCCTGSGHNFHFRPGAPRRVGNLISCCCKSVTTVIEAEPDEGADCAHQWKRWPVIKFSLDYQCVVCGEPETMGIISDQWGKSISDLDALLVEKRGGVFAGEMVP